MGTIFGNIYSLFWKSFYGLELDNYMWGLTSDGGSNHFIGIGLIMIAVALAVALLFYYVVDDPRLNRFLGWLPFLIVCFVVNVALGYWWTVSDLNAGNMVRLDMATSQQVPLDIGKGNCLSFGVANGVISCVAFLVVSLIVKWKSTSCSHAPF